MRNQRVVAVAVLAGLSAITGIGVLSNASAQPAPLQVIAAVTEVRCLDLTTAEVTFLGIARGPNPVVTYEWDATSNGSYDISTTQRTAVVAGYPDKLNVTAKLRVTDSLGAQATDTVTFGTLNCL